MSNDSIKSKPDKLLIIVGPTATGKTGLGIKLAKKFNGELVSADSRQVYQGMDIGTGKDINQAKFKVDSRFKIKDYQIGTYTIDGVKIWLLDLVKPDFKFSVADYFNCALPVIKVIKQSNKLPIIVGGTGFYIKALLEGLGSMGIKPDWKLRKKLQNLEVTELQELLKKTCPERMRGMNESDRGNPRRLIRGIEIALSSGVKSGQSGKNLKTSDVLMIGLRAKTDELYSRIDQRVKKRLNQDLEEEIKDLFDRGYDWENSALGSTLAYQEWQPIFVGTKRSKKYEAQISELKEDIIQRWKYDEHAYARRQMAWFRKQKKIKWFDISDKQWQARVVTAVKKWYDDSDAQESRNLS